MYISFGNLQEKNSSVEHWSSKSSSTTLVWSSRVGRACTFHWYLQEKTVRLSIGRAKVVLDQTSLVEQVWSSIYISLVFTGKKTVRLSIGRAKVVLDQTSLVEHALP